MSQSSSVETGVTWGNTALCAVDADITEMAVDAIVNSANTWLALGGRHSVAGAIVRKTQERVEQALADLERSIPLGSVVSTESFGLPCKHILHAATHAKSAISLTCGRSTPWSVRKVASFTWLPSFNHVVERPGAHLPFWQQQND